MFFDLHLLSKHSGFRRTYIRLCASLLRWLRQLSLRFASRFHNGTLMYVSAFVNKRSNLHYSSFNVHAARQRVHALHRDSYIILPQSLAFVNTFFKLFSLFSPLSMLPSILCLSSLFYTIYNVPISLFKYKIFF